MVMMYSHSMIEFMVVISVNSRLVMKDAYFNLNRIELLIIVFVAFSFVFFLYEEYLSPQKEEEQFLIIMF